ncbi:UDP-2,3-diacylglucosamine diphosphatase [Methylovulum psychrotolerans]|uniref:UDP-2,3-diacylglucosamine hydrolase n=1 Tax=Methylovulum psychrotolerans TaxID=1704499 RepID=A0A1Z4C2R6_9GAMM|nr:UDP-2,3-diacylglucosamine diphosphatase [Methylovulum psychrotolerans]ASF47823.1 UDP-2,3-diacylglucosamine diphosphatase [Methylovulum psychrotolerans]
MPQDILFISDLHLALDKPEITRHFVDFLQHRAPQASALYILGDLFDAWLGDDDYTPPNRSLRRHLKHLTDSGTKVYLQVGNRDFLLGQRFCQETGITLLGDYAVIDLFGIPTLLTHGDLLCTDDLPYQTFRVKARTPQWQQNVLSKPLLVRLLAARWFRLRSFFHKRQKSQAIMDVNADTVVNTLREYACLRLIHGHTHRPAVHDLSVDGQAAQRFVLAAWHKQAGEALSWNGGAYRREII